MAFSDLNTGLGPAFQFVPPSAGKCLDPGRVASQKLPKDHSLSYFADTDATCERKIVQPKDLVVNDGIPLVNFNKQEVAELASPFAYTLIGNFCASVPNIAMVAPAFKSLLLEGRFFVSFLDSRRLCIRLMLEEDYIFLKMKGSLFIAGSYMTLLDWSPSYVNVGDSPLVPVWLTLKNVPFMFFQSEALYEIVKLVGKPIRVDDATANLSRLDRVRVYVELDVSKPLLDYFYLVYLGIECKVEVLYDYLPVYCVRCCKLGHEKVSCCWSNSGSVAPKEKVVPVASSKVSGVTSLSDPSGSKEAVVEQVIEKVSIQNESNPRNVEAVSVVEECEVVSTKLKMNEQIWEESEDFPFGFENYFEPEPGDPIGCKDSDELLLLAVGEESSEKDDYGDSFGKYFIYPKPLLTDYNSGVPEFEPCILKHRRRKSEGSCPFENVNGYHVSQFAGSLNESLWSDNEDCISPCFSSYDTHD